MGNRKPAAARQAAPAAVPTPAPLPDRMLIPCLLLALAVLATYANHFQNTFHFDDIPSVTDNVFIRQLSYIPSFFGDATRFSTDPASQSYRPVVSASLAIDYWLGGGLKPFFFHLSTFLWFLVQLLLMFLLFRRIMNAADRHSSNRWTALAATALYGLHPVSAETVNYIIQRGDLYNTAGVVAGVYWFAARPAQRRRGWYLLPVLAAILAKAPALIFPVILLAYVFLVEQQGSLDQWARNRQRWFAAWRACLPAFAVTAAAALFTSAMTSASFHGGAGSPSLYRLSQPWITLHYFRSFFLPTRLSGDSNWPAVSSPWSGEALAGYAFAAGLLALAVYTSRKAAMRPIAFGILWFILALLPVALMPLADLMNDHRMFFPFVGMALAVVWCLRLLLFQLTARLTANRLWLRVAVVFLVLVLAASAAGTYQRNQAWHSEESFWYDAVLKYPGNPRALLNYSRALVARQDYAAAIPFLDRSRIAKPDGYYTYVMLGVCHAALGHDAEAERDFQQSVVLAPDRLESHLEYGRWLKGKGRLAEAQTELEGSIRAFRWYLPPRHLLMEVYAAQGNRQALEMAARDTLSFAPADEISRRYLAESSAPAGIPSEGVSDAAALCRAGKFPECLTAAQKSLALNPDSAEAYNTLAVALLTMQRWDEGIQAARKALQIRPDYPQAKTNLELGLEQKRRAQGGGR